VAINSYCEKYVLHIFIEYQIIVHLMMKDNRTRYIMAMGIKVLVSTSLYRRRPFCLRVKNLPGNLRLNEVINELKFRRCDTPVVCRCRVIKYPQDVVAR